MDHQIPAGGSRALEGGPGGRTERDFRPSVAPPSPRATSDPPSPTAYVRPRDLTVLGSEHGHPGTLSGDDGTRSKARGLRVCRAAWLIGISVRRYRGILCGEHMPNLNTYRRITELLGGDRLDPLLRQAGTMKRAGAVGGSCRRSHRSLSDAATYLARGERRRLHTRCMSTVVPVGCSHSR
jgi:hypothetical protein